MNKIDKALQDLALSEKAVLIYKTLLEHGSLSAHTLAVTTNLKRTTVYSIIKELRDQALVSEIPGSKMTLYRCLSPRIAFERRKNELRFLAHTIPEIEAQLNQMDETTTKPRSLYFSGKKGLITLLNHDIEDLRGHEFREFLLEGNENNLAIFKKDLEAFSAKLDAYGVSERAISPESRSASPEQRHGPKKGFETKTVPDEVFGSPVAVEVGHSWVKIYDLENLQGMLLKSRAIAKCFGQIFDLAWKGAGEHDLRH